MAERRGLLIAFEGTEGVGKSTLMRNFAKALKKSRIPFVQTREPGGTPLSEKIRRLILNHEMAPTTELLLYEAARAEHVEKLIRPSLAKGKWVICDRFTDSTLAYQAHARGLDWKEVAALNDSATQKLRPDCTVFLDLDPKNALGRAKNWNRFEREGVAFQRKVRAGFLRAKKARKNTWIRLEVSGKSPAELTEELITQLEKKLKIRTITRRQKK